MIYTPWSRPNISSPEILAQKQSVVQGHQVSRGLLPQLQRHCSWRCSWRSACLALRLIAS